MSDKFKVKDISLADKGRLDIQWAESRMPVMMEFRKEYGKTKPLKGQRIAGCLHVTKETAVLIETLAAAGAEISWSGCNPLSTNDSVAAALAKNGTSIYAWHGMNREEFYWCIEKTLEFKPTLTLDDGADLIMTVHTKRPEYLKDVIGGTEETTTGVHRLRAMAREKALKYPVIAINDAETKWDFDNVYGTGQSSWDGVIRATSVLIAGKTFVSGGYGHCGKGCSERAKGMGANVIVTEVKATAALKATLDGHRVMKMDEAAKYGDIFITATGMKDVLVKRHFEVMKDGAIICNTGHYDCEINIPDLESIATSKRTIRDNCEEYTLKNGRRVFLLAQGRLVNLAAAEGHPSEVMDMSFANQFLGMVKLAQDGKSMAMGVHDIDPAQDQMLAQIKLRTMGYSMDTLTPEQADTLTIISRGPKSSPRTKLVSVGKMDRREFLKKAAVGTTVFAGMEGISLFAAQGFVQNLSQPNAQVSLDVIALTRMGFGPSANSLAHFQRLGANTKSRFNAYLEEQISPDHIDDKLCNEKLSQQKLTTLNKGLVQLWADHVVAAEEMKDSHDLRMLPINEVEQATWIKAVYSKRQLHEALVGFWHSHFNVFGFEQKISPVFVHYDRDVIRHHAWGNFRDMLEAVAKSPAMLLYLDNATNQSGNPNENYARELFELHTLGAENYLGTMERTKVPGFAKHSPRGYVDGDVYESARCFTGWRIDQGKNSKDTGQFDYYDQWHDRFQKIVLGRQLKEYQPPLKDGHDVLDILASHPGTAKYISRKLCRRFVSDTPSESLVERTAKIFTENAKSQDQMKIVLASVLNSDEFQNTWGQKIKRPFEATVGMLRATGADFTPTEKFIKSYERTGQRLFQWRTPDGYPDFHEKWLGTNSTLEKWKLFHQMAVNMDGVDIKEIDGFRGVNQSEIYNQWPKKVLGHDLAPESRKAIEKFLSGSRGPNWIPTAMALVFMSPDYQWS